MRDRFIELLDELGVIVNVPVKVDEDGCGTYTIEGSEYVADYLLANGVVVIDTDVNVFESNDYSDDDVAIECAVNYGTDVANIIYELEEKYTEGEHNG